MDQDDDSVGSRSQDSGLGVATHRQSEQIKAKFIHRRNEGKLQPFREFRAGFGFKNILSANFT